MKKQIIFLIMCLIGLHITAQTAGSTVPTTLQGWVDRLQKFGNAVPQEQIFVHMDNTCYFLGDTLFYKAYVNRSDGKPSKLSGVLYAELLNQDGYLVERQFVELKSGQGHGSFVLTDSLYGGFYELRAYTRWQLNWGQTEHAHTPFAKRWFFKSEMAKDYYRDYEKLYSRVFPVYDKPSQPGDYVRDMTTRPLRRYFKSDTEEETVLAFYPEGGHLVAGVPNRVAFEVNDKEGKHLEGTIHVEDSKGTKVAETKTEQRGRGSVEFTPIANETYTAIYTGGQNKKKEELPKVENDGCGIKVTQNGEKVQISIQSQGIASSENLGLTILNQGVLQDFIELEPNKSHTINLDTSKLHTGVNQVTLFNAQGRIYADRLFFLNKGDMATQQLTISGINNKGYEAFSPIEVTIEKGVPGSTLSVAVRDAIHQEYLHDNGNILTEMLLSSQIRGFVENPGYFFEKDDEEHRRALDLLLMIQGWRRYDWKTMATPGLFQLQHMPEFTHVMNGEVYKYEAKEPANAQKLQEGWGRDSLRTAFNDLDTQRKNTSEKLDNRFLEGKSELKREVLTHAEFIQPGSKQNITGDIVTKNACFQIQSPKFYQKCHFHLSASDTTKWKKDEQKVWVAAGEDVNETGVYPEFYVRLNPFFPRFVKPYTWYQDNVADVPEGAPEDETGIYSDTKILKEMVVRARRNGMRRFDDKKPALVVDAYQAFNEVCDAGFCTGMYMGMERFIDDVARNYIGDMNMERSYFLSMRLDSRNQTHNIKASELDEYNLLSNLDKVYIYTDYSPRREGDKRFEGADQPSVTVDLRRIKTAARQMVYRDRYYTLQGFSVCEDFYQPNYAQKPLAEVKDYRRTLYWNPNVKLDEAGKTQLKFYNNNKKTHIVVSAEGVAPDGKPLTGKNS